MDPERAIREADPAACVVEPRIVRRILRKQRGVRGSGLQVPHGRCYWIDRESFESLTTSGERGGVTDLPADVIIVARPNDRRIPVRLRELWRAVFHARVHLALEALRASGRLG